MGNPPQYRVNRHGETSVVGVKGMAYRFARFWVPMGGEKYAEGYERTFSKPSDVKLGPLKGGRRRVVYGK